MSRPCKRCGGTERYKDGHCVNCRRADSLDFDRANPEKANQRKRTWVSKNPDYKPPKHNRNPENNRERAKRWAKNNPDRVRENARKWRLNNPDKERVKQQRRRSRINNADGDHTAEEWRGVINKQNRQCLACGGKEKLTVDHIVPLSMGGTNNIANIQGLCLSCNSKKGTKTKDYRKS